MNGVNIGTFDLNSPADTASAGLGDDAIRSVKSTLQQVLADEHHFPSAGGASVGYHRFGSARVYHDEQSRVSSSGTDGRVMITSDTSRFFGVGSGGTVFIGGPGVVSIGSFPGGSTPQRHIWMEEIGIALASDGSVAITIPNSGYSGLPFIWASLYTTTNPPPTDRNITVIAATASSFSVQVTDSVGGYATHAFVWRSLGTRVL